MNNTIIERIKKLLALADNNSSAAEAESAMAKVSQLLIEHNLTMASLGEKSDRVRTDFNMSHYEHVQKLWKYVAYSNFCYLVMRKTTETVRKPSRHNAHVMRDVSRVVTKASIVGLEHNVAASEGMIEYLVQTIERLVNEKYAGGGTSSNGKFGKAAYSFRHGIVQSLVVRLWNIRKEVEAKESETKVSGTGNALSVVAFSEAENNANVDMMWGEGTAARWREQMAREEKEEAEEEAAFEKWCEENPKKAAAARAKREKAKRGKERKIYDWSAYFDGQHEGDQISLNKQVDTSETKLIAKG